MKKNKIRIGNLAEKTACQYLQQQGLQLITNNFRCKVGELDLIMQDNDMMVFVEVRYRQDDHHGNSLESITYAKQCKIIAAARYYLVKNELYEKIQWRFDIVAIDGMHAANDPKIDWLKNAFFN